LLKKSIKVKCFQKGLRRAEDGRLYFPFNLFDENILHFKGYKGEKTRIKVASERDSIRLGRYFYNLSPQFIIKREADSYIAQLLIKFYLTDEKGGPFKGRSETARQKNIRRSLWNGDFLNRSLAVVSFLSEGSDEILIGRNSEEQIVLSRIFMNYESPCSISEEEKVEEIENDIEEVYVDIDEGEREEFFDEVGGEVDDREG
jgi:hypothetical protein